MAARALPNISLHQSDVSPRLRLSDLDPFAEESKVLFAPRPPPLRPQQKHPVARTVSSARLSREPHNQQPANPVSLPLELFHTARAEVQRQHLRLARSAALRDETERLENRNRIEAFRRHEVEKIQLANENQLLQLASLRQRDIELDQVAMCRAQQYEQGRRKEEEARLRRIADCDSTAGLPLFAVREQRERKAVETAVLLHRLQYLMNKLVPEHSTRSSSIIGQETDERRQLWREFLLATSDSYALQERNAIQRILDRESEVRSELLLNADSSIVFLQFQQQCLHCHREQELERNQLTGVLHRESVMRAEERDRASLRREESQCYLSAVKGCLLDQESRHRLALYEGQVLDLNHILQQSSYVFYLHGVVARFEELWYSQDAEALSLRANFLFQCHRQHTVECASEYFELMEAQRRSFFEMYEAHCTDQWAREQCTDRFHILRKELVQRNVSQRTFLETMETLQRSETDRRIEVFVQQHEQRTALVREVVVEQAASNTVRLCTETALCLHNEAQCRLAILDESEPFHTLWLLKSESLGRASLSSNEKGAWRSLFVEEEHSRRCLIEASEATSFSALMTVMQPSLSFLALEEQQRRSSIVSNYVDSVFYDAHCMKCVEAEAVTRREQQAMETRSITTTLVWRDESFHRSRLLVAQRMCRELLVIQQREESIRTEMEQQCHNERLRLFHHGKAVLTHGRLIHRERSARQAIVMCAATETEIMLRELITTEEDVTRGQIDASYATAWRRRPSRAARRRSVFPSENSDEDFDVEDDLGDDTYYSSRTTSHAIPTQRSVSRFGPTTADDDDDKELSFDDDDDDEL